MEKLHRREKTQSKICKKWLVVEGCSSCLFETLCRLEEQKKKQQQEN